MKHVALLMTALFLGLTLASCGGEGTTDETTESAPTESEPSVMPGQADCVIDRPAPDRFGLTFTRLLRTNKGLLVEWETNRPMPPSGTVLYVIDATDDAGNVGLQLGVKYLDGSQIAFYVFDFATQTNLPGGAIRNGNRLEAMFPQAGIADLEGRFRWRSILNVRGDDVDACPSRGDGPLPAKLPFPE